jgi:predicted dehydrogenase
VLSEKPIAKDLATARELLDWYHKNIDTTKVIWAVAENFRYLGRFQFAAEQVKGMGPVLGFHVRLHTMVKPGAKYYETEWRKTPEHQVCCLGLEILFYSQNKNRVVSSSTAASTSSPQYANSSMQTPMQK